MPEAETCAGRWWPSITGSRFLILGSLVEVLAAVLLLSCATPRGGQQSSRSAQSRTDGSADATSNRRTAACFSTTDLNECPNWEKALAQARKRAGCLGSTGDPASRCQKRLARCSKGCDICKILEPGIGPKALQWNLSADPRRGQRGQTCPPWSFSCPGWGNLSPSWEVMFHKLFCTKEEYLDIFAGTMIHEAVHSCASITGKAITDREAPECDPYEIERECVE